MATNHLQSGNVVQWTNAGTAVVSGASVLVGNRIGIALVAIANGATGSVALTDAWRLVKTTGYVIAVGDDVFWDPATAKTAPDGPIRIGKAISASASGVLTADVLLVVECTTLPITHHAAGWTLTAGMSGSVHTNLGAGGATVATLPQSPPKGTNYQFVCMADQEIRLEPGAAGGIYVKGAKQADDKYVSMTDIGDFVHLIADGNGDWVAVASINGADADLTVES